MAEQTPTKADHNAPGTLLHTYSAAASGDTFAPLRLGQAYPLGGSAQVIGGTWGSATVTLQVSHDGANWFTAKDVQGDDITFTDDGYFEFSSAAVLMRFSISGAGASGLIASINAMG